MPFKLDLECQKRFYQVKLIVSDVQRNFASHGGHKLAAGRLKCGL